MNTDIRVSIGLHQHPKYKKLRRLISRPPMEYLIIFWGYVAAYKPDGDLSGWTADEIEDAANWDGKKGAFCAHMIEAGFLDQTDDGYYPHDWHEHQQWVIKAKERSAKARSAASTRWKDKTSIPPSNATSIPPSNAHGNAPSPSPSPLPKPLTTEGEYAREKMPLSEVHRLHVEYLGKIPDSQPVITVLQGLVRDYPPDRLRIAFQAVEKNNHLLPQNLS